MNFRTDGVVETLIIPQLPKIGYACEVGANDGVANSQSLPFEESGWTVLCIEPNPRLAEDGKKARKLWVEAAAGANDVEEHPFYAYGTDGRGPSISGIAYYPQYGNHGPTMTDIVKVRRLDRLLDEAGFPGLDLLIIDVEGHEKSVLKGFTIERWKPAVMVIESLDNRFTTPDGYVKYNRHTVDNIYVRIDSPEREPLR